MAKRKMTAIGLAKISGLDGKLSAALPVGYANLLADLNARGSRGATSRGDFRQRELILLYWGIRMILEAQC